MIKKELISMYVVETAKETLTDIRKSLKEAGEGL